MVPSYLRSSLKLLELTVFLISLFATSGLKQCGPKTIVIIKNVGIKMCQLKCIEIGQCLSYDYNVETLTCRLSRDEPPKVEKKEGYINHSKNHSDESSGSCVARTCRLGQRCLKSRSGKAVCVQDEKQIHYEESQRHTLDKLVTSVDDQLHDACRKGEMSRVKRILCRELVEVNIRDKTYGRTPLMVAVLNGHRDVVDFLVSEGGNVSQVDNNGDSALHLACRRGDVAMVKHLVSEHSVDVNRKAKIGKIPLMVAAYYGHSDVFDVLMKMGGNVSQVDDFGNTILHWTSRGGHAGMMKHFVSEYSVDVNRKGKRGKTLLMDAAYYGHRDVFDVLMKMGANVSQVDDAGSTILHWACRGGHVGMMKHLVSEYSVDVNRKGKGGKTPLMTAVYNGHIDVVDFLVSEGANVSQVGDAGNTILYWACRGGHVDMVKHLVSEYSVDVNRKGKRGKTLLMEAAFYGHRDMFDVLMSEGADLSQMDDDGDNILHYASIGGHTKMVKYIISENLGDINSIGRYGRTPLMKAVSNGHRKAFEILVKKGGLSQLVDDQGQNILHLACLGGHVEIVKHIFSQNMTDVNTRDNDGDTAAMIAKRTGNPELYNLLV